MIDITVTQFIKDLGSLWLMEGIDSQDNLVRFTTWSTQGQDMMESLASGEEVTASMEDYLVRPVAPRQ